MIPGAYERNTLTYPAPGSMGTHLPVDMPAGCSSMDAATIEQRQREGGGTPSEPRRTTMPPADNRSVNGRNAI
jgi:hypothetical protein